MGVRGAALVTAAVFAAVLIGVYLALRPRIPPKRRRAVLAAYGVMFVVTMSVVWAFGAGHRMVGVGVLVAVFILPQFVTTPLRVRRSRRAAREKRARDS